MAKDYIFIEHFSIAFLCINTCMTVENILSNFGEEDNLILKMVLGAKRKMGGHVLLFLFPSHATQLRGETVEWRTTVLRQEV